MAAKMLEESPGMRLKFWNFNDFSMRYAALAQDNLSEAEKFKYENSNLYLLVIDDLGKRKGKFTPSDSDFLYAIINRIYENDRMVWISANLSANDLLRKFEDVDIGQAIIDRFDRMITAGDMAVWRKGC